MNTDNMIHVSNCPTCGHFPTQCIDTFANGQVIEYRALPIKGQAEGGEAVGWVHIVGSQDYRPTYGPVFYMDEDEARQEAGACPTVPLYTHPAKAAEVTEETSRVLAMLDAGIERLMAGESTMWTARDVKAIRAALSAALGGEG